MPYDHAMRVDKLWAMTPHGGKTLHVLSSLLHNLCCLYMLA